MRCIKFLVVLCLLLTWPSRLLAAATTTPAAVGNANVPHATTLPTTCGIGDSFMDTDATTGQRFYLCESANTWTLQGDGAGGGAGTVTVVGAGSLTSTALMTGGGTTTAQTPAATATMDASGNISTPGSISTGVGGSAAGFHEFGQGTAPSLGTTSVKLYSPTSVTSYGIVLPGSSATGFMLGTNAANVNTVSYVGFTGTGNVVRTTGSQTSGRCVEIDASGNHIQSANPCGSGAGGTAGAPLFVQTATATAVTAAAETTIVSTGAGSLTIPAAWFTAAGTVMDVRFSGKYSTGAVPGTLQLKLKFGATVVAQTAAFTPIINVTDGVYSGFVRLIARTIGATGTIFVADGLLTTGSTITPGETIFSNPTLGTAVTIDTTGTNVVDLTATWGTGATNSITGYTFELVGPGSAVSSVFGMTGAIANLSGGVTTSGSSVATVVTNANLTGHVTSTGNAAVLGSFTVAQLNTAVSDADVATLAGTEVLTNKTVDCGGTGNACTIKQEHVWDTAGCNNVTAGPVFNLPTSNPAVATCDFTTNVSSAYMAFNADTDNAFEGRFKLPTGTTGSIDWIFDYKMASATTGAVGWCVQMVRVLPGTTAEDPAYPAQAAGNCVSDTVPGTAGLQKEARITAATCTSCAAGDTIYFRVSRDANGGAVTDSATGNGELLMTGPAYAVVY